MLLYSEAVSGAPTVAPVYCETRDALEYVNRTRLDGYKMMEAYSKCYKKKIADIILSKILYDNILAKYL